MIVKKINIRVKGKVIQVPAIDFEDCVIIIMQRFIKIAEIFDEYWLERSCLPDPLRVIDEIKKYSRIADLFTFTQRIPDTKPHYSFPFQWENKAVIKLTTYDDWFHNKISPSTRRNIRISEKRGVVVRVAQFDDLYVKGIMGIYNESPIRQGKHFWHYSKDREYVRAENSTYVERSTFLAAYYLDEMIGYCKIVWDERTASIMQIMSQRKFYDKRPNNALMAEAVKQCCNRRKQYLLYESFVYGNKVNSSLTEYKSRNGFVKMDIPRYFVPLTLKGKIALNFGLHRKLIERIPQWIVIRLIGLRMKYYKYRYSK